MLHPDEGTLHAWLDGALPPDERARIEAHVTDCTACSEAVAEARGLIAASSRILTALDDVPALRPVPAAAPAVSSRPRRLTSHVARERIAAVVALVIAGSVLATAISRRPAPGTAVRNAASEQAAFEVAAGDSPAPAPPAASSRVARAPAASAPAAPSPERARAVLRMESSAANRVERPVARTDDTLRVTTLAQLERLDERDLAGPARTAAPAAAPTREAAAPRATEARGVAGGVAKPAADAVANALGRRSAATESRYAEKALADAATPPAIRLVQQETMDDVTGRVHRRIYLVDGLLVTLDERALVRQQEVERTAAPAAVPALPDSQGAAATATHTIRWTDARGVERTLTGAATVEQLERVKARLGY